MSEESIKLQALSSRDGISWECSDPAVFRTWPSIPEERVRVGKLVLGDLDSQDGEIDKWGDVLEVIESSDFGNAFPNLTHLYLWGIGELTKVGSLPEGLRCLNVRKCPEFESLASLPGALEELVLWDCVKLPISRDRPDASFDSLLDLSVKNLKEVHGNWITAVMQKAPLTRLLEISGCENLEAIDEDWPEGVEDIRLNENPRLKALPEEKWPSGLRRLELEGSQVSGIDKLPEGIDYLNLRGMRKLTGFPQGWDRAKTLYLYGSGLLEPPVSEQGENAQDNVAEQTKDYFSERELIGDGTVRRCKVLVLGNGSAGKTCFSRGLVGEDTRKTESTEGIQFLTHELKAPVKINEKVSSCKVPVHVWDFGGQEIYHDVHRLFMEAGSVFVVLWDPAQDGKSRPEHANPLIKVRYKDRWRPLKYWFDLIHLACPHQPRIMVVCSRCRDTDDVLRERLQSQLKNPEYVRSCKLVSVDSHPQEDVASENLMRPKGELDARDNWLKKNVGEVISTQGTVVSSSWQIAQELVEAWIARVVSEKPENASFAKKHRQLEFRVFKEKLWEKIQEEKERFPKLRAAIEGNQYRLSDHRLKRVLRFLTRTGWLYWNEGLQDQRVIIGQQWALDGIYALLRREDHFYSELEGRDGRFDTEYFNSRVLEKGDFDEGEKALLLSFMLKFGYLIQIQDVEREWWTHENEYLSVMHLPEVKSEVVQHYQSASGELKEERAGLKSDGFHRANWAQILKQMAEKFGKKAFYFGDAFALPRDSGEDVFVQVRYDGSGLGAELEVVVRGEESA